MRRLELLVVNATRQPAARNASIASALPGIGVSPRHTTPSRSQQTTRAFGSVTGFVERVLVVGVVGAHHDREPEMRAGARAIPGTEAAQRDPVVRVVVDRLEVERGAELALGVPEAPGRVVRAGERFAHRALLRLEAAGPFERDDGRVRVAVGQQPRPFLECRVGVAVVVHLLTSSRTGMDLALWYNRSAFPNPERSVPDFFAFAGLRYDCDAAG